MRSKDAQKQLARTSLMTGPPGNSEFCFSEPLNVPLGFASGNTEGLRETNTIQYNLLINSPTGVFQNQFTYNNGKK